MPGPTGAEPRLAAARALSGVLDGGRSLTGALKEFLAGLPEARDRALARRLAAGVLRDLPALELRLQSLIRRPLPRGARVLHFLLLSALAELVDRREPPHGVVNATVSAVRAAGPARLSGLANGVLRNYLRRAGEIESGLPADPGTRFGFPAWLVERVQRDWADDWESILSASNQPPPVWLRVNRRRIGRRDFLSALEQSGHPARSADGLPDAVVLEQPASITALPGFCEGWFSVQDGAAQATVDWLELEPGQLVLDACAAPGGKAAHALERAEVELVAVELDGVRMTETRAGLERLGHTATLVTADAAAPESWWDGRPFDRILLDAPCSATGVIRRHPDIRWLRRPDDIEVNARLQSKLLEGLWPLLRPGGMLVYATCSILAEENQQRIHAFLDRTPDAREQPPDHAPGRSLAHGHQTLPGEGGMDGFYHCRLVRLHPGD